MSTAKKPAPARALPVKAPAPVLAPGIALGLEDIKALIGLVAREHIDEFEMETGTMKFRIRKGGTTFPAPAPQVMVPAMPTPSMPTHTLVAPAQPPAEDRAEDPGIHHITSPIVGTYYRSPTPNGPSYVQPGDFVKPGQTLCIVEAMKLMNEIECDVAGEVVAVLVENGQPVEYGERLFAVRVR
jgi:acetyl-CoA carboxylase biotin carboxyl carrier protein